MPKKMNKGVITCNDQNIKGEKFVQIALNKEQRACLLDTIICSTQKYECLIPVIGELEKCVRKEDPERHERICLNGFLMSKCG